MRIFLLPILLFFIAGCTMFHEKLESYVGKDIQEVVADYGNPDVAFVMDNGRRDFQWTMKMTSSMPAQAISAGALTSPADQFNPDIEVSPLIPMYGGQAVASECSYIMITQWDEARMKWIMTGYQKPKSGC